MWLLLVALSLAQELADAISRGELSHENPKQFMNISGKIHFQGYPSKEYDVLTDDGYFLSVNRIPHGRGSRSPVLIVHGFSLDGGDWVDNLPDSSLGFILADAGYDVWIGNCQGNSWSQRHLNLSVDQKEFWDFSFHEMAMYDVPAMVNFILQHTGQEKLFYIGHAQGNSLGFIAFSSMPHLAEKINLFFALAPLYTFHHVKGPVLKIAFLPDTLKERAILAKTCSNMLIAEVCENEIFLIGGYNKKNLNCSRCISFSRIEDMKVPTALWSGGQDWVNPPPETRRLLFRITNVIHHEHFPDWNHFDHHWGKDAPQRIHFDLTFYSRN
uniref:Partial AB-hydrolase lipase domain-containing protein n=1 Tax=Pavo cristatus TaxID=9049 RepID=A0A8C9EZ78_PAVCR